MISEQCFEAWPGRLASKPQSSALPEADVWQTVGLEELDSFAFRPNGTIDTSPRRNRGLSIPKKTIASQRDAPSWRELQSHGAPPDSECSKLAFRQEKPSHEASRWDAVSLLWSFPTTSPWAGMSRPVRTGKQEVEELTRQRPLLVKRNNDAGCQIVGFCCHFLFSSAQSLQALDFIPLEHRRSLIIPAIEPLIL